MVEAAVLAVEAAVAGASGVGKSAGARFLLASRSH